MVVVILLALVNLIVFGVTISGGAEQPALHWADASRNGQPYSKDPCVISFGGRYLLYYSMPPSTNAAMPAGWAIGIAESSDLLEWRKIGELLPSQECDRNGLCAPGALVLNGHVHLFYQTYGNGPKDAICHAVSHDGIHFTRDPSNPVFRPSGAWTSGRAIDAEAFPAGDQLLLYFATRDPAMKRQMLGVAGADLKSDFGRTAWKQLCDAPILTPELPWERLCIEAPSVIRRDDGFYLFYAGGFNNEPQQIGVAASRNGIHWKRVSDAPLIPNGLPGEWNSSESGHPGVFQDPGGRTYLFFQGNNNHGKTWFLSAIEIGWNSNGPAVDTCSPKFPLTTSSWVRPGRAASSARD
jgi:predicted GH43/DUF377 family glycosyl hydrolase